MKKREIGIIVALLLLLATGISVFAATIGGAQQEINRIQQEVNKTRARLKELDSLRSDVEKYMKELDNELTALSEELLQLEQQMADKQEEIRVTKEELEAAREDERRQYEAMKIRIQYMYEKGDTEYVDILFSAQSLSDLLNSVEYISQISEYDRDMLDVYVAVKEEIQDKEARLEAEYAELEELKTENEAKQAALETVMEAKQAELDKYDAEIGDAEMQLEDFEEDIAEQQEIIRQIEIQMEESRRAAAAASSRAAESSRVAESSRRAAEASRAEESRKAAESSKTADASMGNEDPGDNIDREDPEESSPQTEAPEETTTQAPTVSSSGHIWPIGSRNITSYFGPRTHPITGVVNSHHSGIDIAAPNGTPIVASASGTVLTVGYTSINGNYVIIYHGDGVATAYCHCSTILVSEGQQVSQGQTIAKVGLTGLTNGYHLHYGVRVNGTYVNPLNYIQ